MTNDLAARALQAHKAETEAREHEKEAQEIRREQDATNALYLAAAEYGISGGEILPSKFRSNGFTMTAPLTDDATLVFEWYDDTVSVRVKPSDQLYWDLQPGVEEKPSGGGVYSCYGLNTDSLVVTSLASLGSILERIAAARASWQRKHGATR